jgi:glycosyltransferase involved in cell wall biosynthesis
MNSELTIIIPSKNEAQYIGQLLESILKQNYPAIASTKIFVADANSTDATKSIVESYRNKLPIEIIPGGLPGVGRNAGARRATSEFILFLDADMQLQDPKTISASLHFIQSEKLTCIGAYAASYDGNLLDNLYFTINNAAQKFIPYVTGFFMLFRRADFEKLGGFDERASYCEDLLLSKKIPNAKLGFSPARVFTSGRHFQRLGYIHQAMLVAGAVIHQNNPAYFYRSFNYWPTKSERNKATLS